MITDMGPNGTQVYKRLQAQVISTGLCTHCGTCAGLSEGTLQMQDTPRGPLPVAVGATAHLPLAAYEACPGKGLDYPGLCERVFGQMPANWLIGCQRSAHIGYSRVPEIRRRGASGGVITQTLNYLLERGLVDGAVVVRQGQPKPWQAQPIIATTVAELLAASQSVYVPVPVNSLLGSMESFPGRLAYVGLPDQVASLRRLQALGHRGAGKVEYVLGPYVGTIMYFAAIESYLRSHGVRSLDEVTELRYREGEWPGYLQIRTRDGRVLRAAKFYYNYLIPFYVTRSTLFSADLTNELTDISVGDAWHPRYEARGEGFSVVIARSKKGQDLLFELREQGLLSLEDIPLPEALSMHGHMLDFKKRGAFIRMGWRRALGRPVPDYGYRPTRLSFSRRATELVITGLFVVCSTRLARRLVEHVPIGLIGPLFDGLRRAWKGVSRPVKRRGLAGQTFEVQRHRERGN